MALSARRHIYEAAQDRYYYNYNVNKRFCALTLEFDIEKNQELFRRSINIETRVAAYAKS